MTFTYRAADGAGWLAFVTDSRVLLVVPADAQFVDAAWSALASSTGFQSALDVLTGRGLAATPDFVLLEWEGGTARVIVRGAAGLTVVADGGTHEVSGAGASTWVERTLEGVESVAFAAPGSAEGGIGLPVERGVVPVAHFGSAGAPAAPSPIAAPERETAPAAEPQPASVPVPEPAPVEIDVEATVPSGLSEALMTYSTGKAAKMSARTPTRWTAATRPPGRSAGCRSGPAVRG